MFSVLLESGGRRRVRRPAWTLGSAAAHAFLVTVAVAATTRVAGPVPVGEVVRPVVIYRDPSPAPRPLRRVDQGATATRGEIVLSRPAIRVPTIPASILPAPQLPGIELMLSREPALGGGLDRSRRDDGAHATRQIFSAAHVDRSVVRHSLSQPRYPAALRNASVEGEVLVRFVVDTLGRVESGSVEIVRAAHAQFARAALEWLVASRYAPALLGGRPVRQLVEQRVNFTLVPR